MSRLSRDSSGALRRFIEHEATGGLILVISATLALMATNIGGFERYYAQIIHLPVSVRIGALALEKPLLLWINDGLMAVFFFLVALEIKREMLDGYLSSRDQVVLPALAAVGGMVAPSLIYAYFNWHDSALLRGWAIPAATDIAFALGVLALLGDRVPLALKVFLLTLATLDDLLAIMVIAFFYTEQVSLTQLGLAAVSLAALLALNRMRVSRLAPYVFIGIALWIFVLKSGVHATLAGVVLGFLIPLRRKDGSPLIEAVEEGLHPYVKFLILPLFAFANAGVPLAGLELSALLAPVPLGIAAGLVVGKPVGILIACVAVVGSGFGRLPEQVNWRHMIGVSALAGIGFTMSLFIGTLAFGDSALADAVRLGVITGSLISASLGAAILLTSPARNRQG
ncbi:MAG: Na+/H+ antiporter NhaA [Rhizobiales bacterium]|nr:Na+/H+ antiporter NhaA [Hyphomicrobiales bacterium]